MFKRLNEYKYNTKKYISKNLISKVYVIKGLQADL